MPQNLIEGIKRLEPPEILDDLFRRTLRCDSLVLRIGEFVIDMIAGACQGAFFASFFLESL